MLIVYGIKPGTEVTFTLKVERPKEFVITEADEKKKQQKIAIDLPEPKGIAGDTFRVTAIVPSDKVKRELRHLLSATRAEVVDGQVRTLTSKQALDRFQDAVIEKLVVKIDDYQIQDERPGIPPFEPHTPAEVIEHVDEEAKTALVDTLMDRTRLSESVRGNSAGRSTSSTAAIPAPDGTAGSAAETASVEPARVTAPPTDPTSTSAAPA